MYRYLNNTNLFLLSATIVPLSLVATSLPLLEKCVHTLQVSNSESESLKLTTVLYLSGGLLNLGRPLQCRLHWWFRASGGNGCMAFLRFNLYLSFW